MISLAGYTEEEKVAIATQYLIPKQLKENGLDQQDVTFLPKASHELIRYYTRESGVRSLERELASICRKVARKHMKKIEGDAHEELKAKTGGDSKDKELKTAEGQAEDRR